MKQPATAPFFVTKPGELVRAAGRLRDMEPIPEVSERILPVHSPGEVQTLLIGK